MGRPVSGAAARLAQLFEEHAPFVLGLCRRLLRDSHEAEDAAQQAFLSAYRSLLGGNRPHDPVAWLATIARNECAARARQRMREPLPAFRDRAEVATDTFADSVRASDVESLRRAIAQLPMQQRRAFLLREFTGLSYGELAIALGVSEPAVESLLFRARQQLRLSLRNALAPVNGLLWLPLRLRDLIASAPDAPVAAKVASATAGVALVTTGVVAVAPVVSRGHHRPPLASAPVRRVENRVAAAPRSTHPSRRQVLLTAVEGRSGAGSRHGDAQRRRHEAVELRKAEVEAPRREGEKREIEKPEERAAPAPQPVEQEHSGGGGHDPTSTTGSADSGGSRDGGSSVGESSVSSSGGGTGSGSDSGSGSGD